MDLLLDRDGTLIKDKHYLSDPDGVALYPGVAQALARLARGGARLFVVTNQSGIGRGYFSEAAYHACQKRLEEELARDGATLHGQAFCPHAPEADCDCRKPRTGMFQALAAAHGLDAANCVMVGDKEADLNFGRNAGCRASILVLTGKGRATAERLGMPLPPAVTGTGERGWVIVAKDVAPQLIVARDVVAACDAIEDGLEEVE